VFQRRAGPLAALAAAALGTTAAYAALLPREVTSMAGKPAPLIKAKSVKGTPVDSEAARGKVLLVNFFASWCPPCNKERGDLKALRARIPADKLAIVGVAMDRVVTPNTVPQVKPVVEKHRLNFPPVSSAPGCRPRNR
jgi:thiol-disulfide isomerase/thioredoxin